jgi:Skp family chaperone for outer membrane proteins
MEYTPGKTIPIVVLGLLLSALSATAARRVQAPHGALRIGYVSLQRILKESSTGQADSARLEAARQDRVKDMRAKQQALEATRLQLARARGVDPAATARLSRLEDEQAKDLDRAAADAQQALQALQHRLQDDVRSRLTAAVDEVAKRRSIQMVLNEDNGVLWAAQGADLTDDVLAKLSADAPQSAPAH